MPGIISWLGKAEISAIGDSTWPYQSLEQPHLAQNSKIQIHSNFGISGTFVQKALSLFIYKRLDSDRRLLSGNWLLPILIFRPRVEYTSSDTLITIVTPFPQFFFTLGKFALSMHINLNEMTIVPNFTEQGLSSKNKDSCSSFGRHAEQTICFQQLQVF